MEPHTGNEAFKLKVVHESGDHCRADDSQYMAHHLSSYLIFITETAYYDTTRTLVIKCMISCCGISFVPKLQQKKHL